MLSPPAPITNHREREKGVLVYPVYSRRSGGLSVGINLFPDKKSCPFDCPYCEVFPFLTEALFSLEQMEHDLRAAIVAALKQNIPVKDICFSGNGEPSLSPHFPEALQLVARIRSELVPSAELVLITNGAGLLQPSIFSLLQDAAGSFALNIWLKLDAGTSLWYKKINRTEIPFEKLIAKIKEFVALAPVTIQTMLCAVGGESPPSEEVQAWEQLMLELAVIAQNGTGTINKIQMYGKARPAPDDTEGNLAPDGSRRRIPKAQALPIEYLENRATSLRHALVVVKINLPPVEVYP